MVRHKDKADRPDDADADANRDPISGAPGAHPLGVGAGTAGLGAAGAAIGGAVGGPVGAAIGAVAGGVGGGLIGKAAAEQVNPTAEDAYWRESYVSRPYVNRHDAYEEFQPAYRYGWESYGQYRGQYSSFDEAEPHLSGGWEGARGRSALNWERARSAARDAWDRLDRAQPGDAAPGRR